LFSANDLNRRQVPWKATFLSGPGDGFLLAGLYRSAAQAAKIQSIKPGATLIYKTPINRRFLSIRR
jgi:hypothetical protein